MHSNTENFREAALTFKETGAYCNYPVNEHPNSQYMKYWNEETRRCIEGLNLGYDWIPGYFYWYLNYSPIYLVEYEDLSNNSEDRIRGSRIKDFPKFWDSDYDYYHYLEEAEAGGHHGTVLKTRGRGYSFKGGSMLTRNYFLLPGSKSYAIAYEKEYLINDGILTKAWDVMDFVDTHTPWSKRKQFKNTAMHKRASYESTLNGVKVEKGYKSEIIGISLKDSADKARGKRGKLILWEEAGRFPGLLKSWQIARPSMEQGKVTFGLMVAFGTGGTEGANFEALEELFYYPEGYNVHAVTNIWDKGVSYTSKSGLFIPEYMNMEGCYDEDGNSDIVKATKEEELNRELIRKNSSNTNAVTRYIAEKPFTPQEATLRVGGTIFPVKELKEVLSELEVNKEKNKEGSWIGRLYITPTGSIDWKFDANVRIVNEFPIKDNKNIEGGLIIWEQPYKDPATGNTPYGMYIAGTDPYDHDESGTDSLGSTFVLNTLTDKVVAEYTGRPSTAHEYYEYVRRILIYFNATCNYENNLKGMYEYFYNKDSTYLLADTPKILVDTDLMKDNMMSRKKGSPGTANVNKWHRELTKSYLLTPISKDTELMNLHRIKSIPFIKELIYWNADGNYDRVSAFGMLMILRSDRFKMNVEKDKTVKSIMQDPFWDRSYKGKIDNNLSYNNGENFLLE